MEVSFATDVVKYNAQGWSSFVLSFVLTNPSQHQDAPGMQLEMFYLISNVKQFWGFEPGVIFPPAWDPNGTPILAPKTTSESDYPLKVVAAQLTASISQSSPWPCTTNTISIELSVSIDLHPRCLPSISLSGLTGSETADSTITVPIAVPGLNLADKASPWTKDGGTLTVDIFENEPNLIILQTTIMTFSFDLFNPNGHQASPLGASDNLYLRMSDTYHTLVLFPVSMTAGAADAAPLYVRQVSVTSASVTQSSTYPVSSHISRTTY